MTKLYTLAIVIFWGAIGYSQCVPPVLSDVIDPDPICSGNPATLAASTNEGTIYWFQSSTTPTPLASGPTYETGNLENSVSYWVESQDVFVGAAQSGGGKLAPTGTSGSSVVPVSSPWGLVFNATQDFLLNSVDVFLTSANPGTIVFQLKDNAFNIIETINVAAPAGGTGSNPVQFSAPLNLTIPVGTGYRLVVVSNPPMIRDLGSAGNPFPFAIGSVGSITQGTINDSNTSNPGVYYFLYNWNFSPISICSSTRQEVMVTVLPTPDAPTGATEQEYTEGETLADLDVTGIGLTWYSDADGMNEIPDSTVLTDDTTYYVSQTDGACTSDLLAVTVNNPLSVATHSFSQFNLYPNPVRSEVNVSNGMPIDAVQIYTMQGRKIFDKVFNQHEISLDLNGFSSGTYLIKVSSNDAVKVSRIIKL